MTSANRMAKEKLVGEIRDQLAPTHAAVIAHYSGINVDKITRLRSDIRKADGKLKVIKNTLLTRAAVGTPVQGLVDKLSGPIAIAFTETDAVALAKTLVDFGKKEAKLKIQGGVLGEKTIDIKEVEALASVPSRQVLLARAVGALQSPYAGLVYTLSGVLRKFVYALDAVRRKKEEEGEK